MTQNTHIDDNPIHPELAAALSIISFSPAQVRARSDGWTPARQRAFITALAESGTVAHAAVEVGMTVTSAYRLRHHPLAKDFDRAWSSALDHAMKRLADEAMMRAMHGIAAPVFHKGEQVGERRSYSDRMTMFLLRAHAPDRYHRQPQKPPPPKLASQSGEAPTTARAMAVKDILMARIAKLNARPPVVMAEAGDFGFPDHWRFYETPKKEGPESEGSGEVGK